MTGIRVVDQNLLDHGINYSYNILSIIYYVLYLCIRYIIKFFINNIVFKWNDFLNLNFIHIIHKSDFLKLFFN